MGTEIGTISKKTKSSSKVKGKLEVFGVLGAKKWELIEEEKTAISNAADGQGENSEFSIGFSNKAGINYLCWRVKVQIVGVGVERRSTA